MIYAQKANATACADIETWNKRLKRWVNKGAKAQIGNEGGDKFWKWYGFEEHVHWCACYVSWCANECDYIEKGIIPKFSVCTDGINWFKEKNEWHYRGENYYPIIGDIIFFDWKDENGNQDGTILCLVLFIFLLFYDTMQKNQGGYKC